MDYNILYVTGLDGWMVRSELADKVRHAILEGWQPQGAATFQVVSAPVNNKFKIHYHATQTLVRTPDWQRPAAELKELKEK